MPDCTGVDLDLTPRRRAHEEAPWRDDDGGALSRGRRQGARHWPLHQQSHGVARRRRLRGRGRDARHLGSRGWRCDGQAHGCRVTPCEPQAEPRGAREQDHQHRAERDAADEAPVGHRRRLICIVPQKHRRFCRRRREAFGRWGGRGRRHCRSCPFKHRREVEYRGEPLQRILTHRASDGVAHRVRDQRGGVSRGSGLEAFEREHGQRVLVGGRPQLPSMGLLACRERAGHGEVAQQRHSVQRHHHVCGFHVAMRHAVAVRVIQRGGELGDETEAGCQPQRARATQHVLERATFDPLHRAPEQPPRLPVLVHRDDVRVIERDGPGHGGRKRLACLPRRAGARDHFQRDRSAAVQLAPQVEAGQRPPPLEPLHLEPGTQVLRDRGVDRVTSACGCGGGKHAHDGGRRWRHHSTVTLLARLRGRSTSQPRSTAM